MSRPRKPQRDRWERWVGVMSGTSLDGIDCVLARLRGEAGRLAWEFHRHHGAAFDPELRGRLLAVAEGEPVPVEEIARLHFALGELYGASVLELLAEAELEPEEIDGVGLSGQTVYHQSARRAAEGGVTFQLGAGAIVAERVGARVVSDLRTADVAAGGEGAPLVPYADHLLFASDEEGRIVLNLGGVANLTAIPRGGPPDEVIAFDSGPGNLVLDGLVRIFTDGAERYDAGGARARAGSVDGTMLRAAMQDPFFAMEPPRTTGREHFGFEYVRNWIEMGRARRVSEDDLIATACALTAESVAEAVRRFVVPRMMVDALYVAGGGAHNPALLQMIADRLDDVSVDTTLAIGLPPESREALAFAVLARETVHGRPGNLPQATGASRPVILGHVNGSPARAAAHERS